jgi:hypothetical protein
MTDDEACGHCGAPPDPVTWRCVCDCTAGASVIARLVQTILANDWSRAERERAPWRAYL